MTEGSVPSQGFRAGQSLPPPGLGLGLGRDA